MSKSNSVEMTTIVVTNEKDQRRRSVSIDNGTGNNSSNTSMNAAKQILRHTQSQNSQRKPILAKKTIPPILENDEGQMQTLNVRDLGRKLSTGSVNTNKSTVRGSNRSAQSNRNNPSQSGIANPSYENSEVDVTSYHSRYSSNQSLSTYKEQYCCSPNCRYTPRERKLCASIAVLATIIVILVAVVGYLAGQDGGENTFMWSL